MWFESARGRYTALCNDPAPRGRLRVPCINSEPADREAGQRPPATTPGAVEPLALAPAYIQMEELALVNVASYPLQGSVAYP